MRRIRPHLTGLLVAGTGVVILSPDGLLVRLVETGPFTLVVYRGSLLFAALALFLGRRGPGFAIRSFWGIGRPGLFVAVFFGASNLFFVLALRHTSVAKTLVILSTGPIFAALFSRVAFGERAGLRTIGAIAAAIVGVAIAVWGGGPGHLTGDLFAVLAASTFAAQLVAIRAAAGRDMTPAVALGGLFAAAAAVPFAVSLVVPGGDVPWLLLLGLVVLPLSFGLISLGPRWLSAAEVNLLMLLETVLGPIWVWLALHEPPTAHELVGGAVVVAALVAHSALVLRRQPAPDLYYRLSSGVSTSDTRK